MRGMPDSSLTSSGSIRAAATRIDSAVELVLQAGVAGILVFAPTAEVIDAVRQHDVPVPVVFESIAASASMGPRMGMRMATEYLADLGHRRFFHVSGPLSWVAAQDRARQFHAVVDERELVSVAEFEGDWSSRSGYEAGLQMPLDQGITAIVVANDQMALGVLRALKQRHLRVPQDISVIGFDDIAEAGYFEPALTTISNDFEGQGRMAMDALLSSIDPRPATRSRVESRSGVDRARIDERPGIGRQAADNFLATALFLALRKSAIVSPN